VDGCSCPAGIYLFVVTEFWWDVDGIGGSGNKQILDARHSELFLEKAYWDETLEYESLGEHFQDEEVAAAFCAVVNAKQFASPSTASMYVRQPSDHSRAVSAQSISHLSVLYTFSTMTRWIGEL
jgi:hypothetical protein